MRISTIAVDTATGLPEGVPMRDRPDGSHQQSASGAVYRGPGRRPTVRCTTTRSRSSRSDTKLDVTARDRSFDTRTNVFHGDAGPRAREGGLRRDVQEAAVGVSPGVLRDRPGPTRASPGVLSRRPAYTCFAGRAAATPGLRVLRRACCREARPTRASRRPATRASRACCRDARPTLEGKRPVGRASRSRPAVMPIAVMSRATRSACR
jgi:hypothetical protein